MRLTQLKMFYAGMLITLAIVTAPAQVMGAGHSSPVVGASPQDARESALVPHLPQPESATNQRIAVSPVHKHNARVLTPDNSLSFLSAVAYDSGAQGTSSVAVADVNGDGKPDLIALSTCALSGCSNSQQVGVLLGNGDGTFQTAVTYGSGGAGLTSGSIAIADVNGDGKPDVVVGNECGADRTSCQNGSVGVLLGNGDGTFKPAVAYGSGGYFATSVAVADVNGDGKPDLLVTNQCVTSNDCSQSPIGVLLGNGDGTFQSAVTYFSGGMSAASVALSDVNGDGRPDLLVANQYFSTVGVLLGNGDGTFQVAVTYGSGGDFPESVAVADANGDGRPDLVVANFGNTLGILLGNGDGTFQAAVAYSSGGTNAVSVAVADVNGDGKADLLVVNTCADFNCRTGTVGVLVGVGDGSFQPALNYDSGGYGPDSIAVADVNGDGKPDLMMANFSVNFYQPTPGVVTVLLNNTPFNDTTPPVISLAATPKILWPPNGKLVPVTISGTITDGGSGVNARSAKFAVHDEYHVVQPQGEIALDPAGNYSFAILLQASRRGNDRDRRRYTIRMSAMDNAGNRGVKATSVTVLHRRPHRKGEDD
jgi:hypothetical protein